MSFSLFRKRAIHLTVFGRSDTGRVRDHNEDHFLIADLTRREASLSHEVREHVVGAKGSLLLVADGMGGAAAGELASEMAARQIYDHLLERWVDERGSNVRRFAEQMKEALETANERIHAYAQAHPELRGMGTTATAVGILGSEVFISQVGDSRAYLVRHGRATQLTKDQSLTRHLVDTGKITEEEAAASDRKNIILQALGPSATVDVDLTRQDVRRGDAIVLCSDGLSGLVSAEEIGGAVDATLDPSTACDGLVDLANSRGGTDNITVIVARLDGDGLKSPQASDAVGHREFKLHVLLV